MGKNKQSLEMNHELQAGCVRGSSVPTLPKP